MTFKKILLTFFFVIEALIANAVNLSGYVGEMLTLQVSTKSENIYSINWSAISGPTECVRVQYYANTYGKDIALLYIDAYYTGTVRVRAFYNLVGGGSKTEYFDITCNAVYLNLKPSSLDLDVGDSEYIYCTLSPTGYTPTVVYTSSNTSVAKVYQSGRDCKVTGESKGTATITVSNSMGPDVTVSVSVKGGNDPDPIDVGTYFQEATEDGTTLLYQVVNCGYSNEKCAYVTPGANGSCAVFYATSKVTIPNKVRGLNVRGMRQYALAALPNIKEIVLPSTLVFYDKWSITNCPNLSSITILAETPPTTLTADIFTSTIYDNTTLYVPKGRKSAYSSAIGWKKFKTIEETGGSSNVVATCAEVNAGTDGTVYHVSGKVKSIENTTYGNWYLEDSTGELYIYGTKDKNGNTGKNNSIADWGIEVGDNIVVEGPRKTYNNIVELVDVTVIDIKKNATTGDGSLASPFTCVAAINEASKLSQGETSSQNYYVKGIISSYKYLYNSQYGTATFYISDDGTTNDQFYVYGSYYLENKLWVDGNPQIAIGDNVIVYGKMTNYNGILEMADKQNYIYSHNGNTKVTNSPKDINIILSSSGYATFYSSESAHKLPSGLSAKVVKAASNGKLTYETIIVIDGSNTNIVPKGVPVMIESSTKQAGTYTLTATESTATYTGTNLLRGSDEATTTTGDGYHYKLSYGATGSQWDNIFGWYWGAQNGAPFQIEGHKAWLVVPKNGSRAAGFTIDGESLGIETIDHLPLTTDYYYDLQGRCITDMQSVTPKKKGVYIRNGQKVVVK